MRISDWSSDVCSSDLGGPDHGIISGASSLYFERLCLGAVATVASGPLPFRPCPPTVFLYFRYGMEDHCPSLGIFIPQRQEGHGLLDRSEEHTSELPSLMRISYAVFCLKKKNNQLET